MQQSCFVSDIGKRLCELEKQMKVERFSLLLYPRKLTEYIVDKFLRTMIIHVLKKFVF